jgi:hypothetical protein
MADLRLMALWWLLAGCGAADAQPASGIAPPAGWQPLPAAAAAARLAAGAPGITIDGAEAWAEPAMGCYAVWMSMHGGSAGTDQLTNDIVAGLATEKITAAVEPGDGPVAFTLEKAPYKGRMRARLVDGQITALACVANQREPASCEAGCTQLLGAIK